MATRKRNTTKKNQELLTFVSIIAPDAAPKKRQTRQKPPTEKLVKNSVSANKKEAGKASKKAQPTKTNSTDSVSKKTSSQNKEATEEEAAKPLKQTTPQMGFVDIILSASKPLEKVVPISEITPESEKTGSVDIVLSISKPPEKILPVQEITSESEKIGFVDIILSISEPREVIIPVSEHVHESEKTGFVDIILSAGKSKEIDTQVTAISPGPEDITPSEKILEAPRLKKTDRIVAIWEKIKATGISLFDDEQIPEKEEIATDTDKITVDKTATETPAPKILDLLVSAREKLKAAGLAGLAGLAFFAQKIKSVAGDKATSGEAEAVEPQKTTEVAPLIDVVTTIDSGETAVEPDEIAAEETVTEDTSAEVTAAEETATREDSRIVVPIEKTREKAKQTRHKAEKRSRQRRRKRKKPHIAVRIISGFFKCVLSLALIAIIAGMFYGLYYLNDIYKDMEIHNPMEIQNGLLSVSHVYDDQGNELRDLYVDEGMREIVAYEDLPQNLINSVIAIEDKTFWTHSGFNITRIVGALREGYLRGGDIQGTSTLSQQLARNIWLSDTRSDYSLTRKIKEAFYARQIERELTKEEILTAYMNTIPLGNHSYGVAAAANQYFGKELANLDLLECAALAALPSSPSTLSMIKTVGANEFTVGDPNILLITSQYTFLYDDTAVPRIHLVLDLMLEQGYITQEEHAKAYKDNIRYHLKPQPLQNDSSASMFIDWMIEDIADDLLREYPDRYNNIDEAIHAVYSGGFQIHSTFNQRMQDIADEEFSNPKNFPIAYMKKDRNGNCLDQDGNIILFAYANLFVTGDDGNTYFRLRGGEKDPDFTIHPNGSVTVYAGKNLGIFDTVSPAGREVSVEIKDFFTQPQGSFYITKGGVLLIPAKYKSMDLQGNLVISYEFFDSVDNFFVMDDKGNYLVPLSNIDLRQSVVQPQGATVVLEHHTGQVKAMVGGRGIVGAMQYNRALSPRQPGSTMKPLGTYGPALEMSAQGVPAVNDKANSFGEYWSPLSIIIDEPLTYNGKVWPKNWYSGYRGPQTLRKAVEQSINVTAVRAQLSVGNRRSVDFLKSLGITTVVEDGATIGIDSATNDLNPSALALGGMTLGIKPIESASAYGTFANAGVHVDPISYTKVLDRDGNVILDGTPQKTQAMDPGTAFIMNDILLTTVSRGISSRGGVKGVPVAGKTGTTTDNFDAWFTGSTAKYSCAIWIGNDVQIQMSQGSAAAAALFSKIMTRICEGEDQGEFPPQPYNVIIDSVGGRKDYFFANRVPSSLTFGQKICLDSGCLATPWCTNTAYGGYASLDSTSSINPDDPDSASGPVWYCPLHNGDPSQYPVDPAPPIDNSVFIYVPPTPPTPPLPPLPPPPDPGEPPPPPPPDPLDPGIPPGP